jgi:hydrogenase-4 component B
VTAELTVIAVSEPQPLPRNDFRSFVAGALTSLVGAVGVWVGVLGMFGAVRAVRIGWLLPLSGVQLDIDPLGGFFMALVGAVAVAVGPYVIGYARHGHLGRVTLTVLPMFVAAMLLVPAAGSVTTFLLAWELMAVASLVLVLDGHTRAQGSPRRIGVCGDDPVGVRGDPGRADGVVGGRRRGPVC